MSANLLKQMLVNAAALLKAERYQEAQDSARRVTQLDPNNFQAFMCVGLASFHLQQVRFRDYPLSGSPTGSSVHFYGKYCGKSLLLTTFLYCSGKTVKKRIDELRM